MECRSVCWAGREILPALDALYLYVDIYTAAAAAGPFLDSVGIGCMIVMLFSCSIWGTIQGRPCRLTCRPCALNSQFFYCTVSCCFTFYHKQHLLTLHSTCLYCLILFHRICMKDTDLFTRNIPHYISRYKNKHCCEMGLLINPLFSAHLLVAW